MRSKDDFEKIWCVTIAQIVWLSEVGHFHIRETKITWSMRYEPKIIYTHSIRLTPFKSLCLIPITNSGIGSLKKVSNCEKGGSNFHY